MSITLERFLPGKRDVSGYTEGHGEGSHSHAIDCSRNDTLTEASKVEIGLDRNTIVAVLTLLGYEINAINMIIYRLVEAESELIVRKEGK